MEIQTKYKIGQIVWFMRSNSPVQGFIKGIVIRVKLDESKNTYSINIEYTGNWYQTQWDFAQYEHSVFATKDDLLKSL